MKEKSEHSSIAKSFNPIKTEHSEIIKTLNPTERKLLQYLQLKTIEELEEKSKLDRTSILRSLEFLSNKNILTLKFEEKKQIVLGTNGVLYKKHELPERKLLNLLAQKHSLTLEEAKKESKLSDNEFKAALGVLKKKALAKLDAGKISLSASKEEISKKMLEEQFLDALPLELDKLQPEQMHSYEQLKNRKDIVQVEQSKEVKFELTEIGKKLSKEDLSKVSLVEQLTPELLRGEKWKGKTFRKYDITSKVPEIYGSKRHFVNQAIDYARQVWTELGFKEMSGTLAETGFWNFDALFTAQDHPVREIQDTFYIKEIKGKLPEKEIVNRVKKSHETGVEGSKGWQYSWTEDDARKVILRTHTTCLSARTLASLSKLKNSKDKRGKFFAIGKCFRNETLDWSHGFEFNQTEGIVVDNNANFKHLLGYLKEFYKKMGFSEVKFVPSYFPYTEPSVEIYCYLKEKKVWIELGGAGIFRPEVVIPLLGEYVPVLAWGPGFDRTLMNYYEIKDLRELYKNDITQLRKMKYWVKV